MLGSMAYTNRDLFREVSIIETKGVSKSKSLETVEKVWYAFTRWFQDVLEGGKGVKIGVIGELGMEKLKKKNGDLDKIRMVFSANQSFARNHNLKNRPALVPPNVEEPTEIDYTKIAIRYSTDLVKDQVFTTLRNLFRRIGVAAGCKEIVDIRFGEAGRLIVRNKKLYFTCEHLLLSLIESREQARIMYSQEQKELKERYREEKIETEVFHDREDDETVGDFEMPKLYLNGDEFDDKYVLPLQRGHRKKIVPGNSCSFLFSSERPDERKFRALTERKKAQEQVLEAAFQRHLKSQEYTIMSEEGAILEERLHLIKGKASDEETSRTKAESTRELHRAFKNQIAFKNNRDEEEIRERKNGLASIPWTMNDDLDDKDKAETKLSSSEMKTILRKQINQRRRKLREEQQSDFEHHVEMLNQVEEDHIRSAFKHQLMQNTISQNLKESWNREKEVKDVVKQRIKNAKSMSIDPEKPLERPSTAVGFDMRTFRKKTKD